MRNRPQPKVSCADWACPALLGVAINFEGTASRPPTSRANVCPKNKNLRYGNAGSSRGPASPLGRRKRVFSCGDGPPHKWARMCARNAFSLSAGEKGDRKAGGEGSLPRLLLHRAHNIPHKLAGVFQHHCFRNAQQSNPDGPQIIFFGSVFAHLPDLSVDAAVEFNGQPMLEAIEIEDPCLARFDSC